MIDVYYLLDFHLERMVILVTAQAACGGFVQFGGSLTEVKSSVMHSDEEGESLAESLCYLKPEVLYRWTEPKQVKVIMCGTQNAQCWIPILCILD